MMPRLGACLLTAWLASANAQAVELVLNGGFEAWDDATTPTSWTVIADANYTGQDLIEFHSGAAAIHTGEQFGVAMISQDVGGTDAAKLYNVEFWVKNDDDANYGGENSMDVLFGSNVLVTESNTYWTGWRQFSFQVFGDDPSTPLVFAFRNDASYFYLDDVSVTEVTNVPDGGATAGLMAFAALGLAGLSPWRRRS